jgi:hypothetical protein
MATSRYLPDSYTTSTYGTGKDYTEGQLSNWEADTDIDLVSATDGEVLDVYKEGSGGLWDDAGCVVAGATVDSSYFRVIRAAAGNGHSGIPKDDGSIAGFRSTTNAHMIVLQESQASLYDLGIKQNGSTGTRIVIHMDATLVRVCGCLVFDTSCSGGHMQVVYPNKVDVVLCNTLIHNCTSGGGNTAYAIYLGAGANPGYVYNSTITNNDVGMWGSGSGGGTRRNVCTEGNTSNVQGLWVTQTCADAQTPTFVDSANDDFHIDAADTDLKDQGTDLSADPDTVGAPWTGFDDDIDEDTRSGTWDIGFDEYQAAAAAEKPVPMQIIINISSLLPMSFLVGCIKNPELSRREIFNFFKWLT